MKIQLNVITESIRKRNRYALFLIIDNSSTFRWILGNTARHIGMKKHTVFRIAAAAIKKPFLTTIQKTELDSRERKERMINTSNDFVRTVQQNIRSYLPKDYSNHEIIIQTVSTGSKEYTGLILKKPDVICAAGSIADLSAYEEMQKELHLPMAEVLQRIAADATRPITDPILSVMDRISDWDHFKTRLYLRVYSETLRGDLLEKTFFRKISGTDLFLVCYATILEKDDNLMSTLVTKDLAEKLGVTEQELFEAAIASPSPFAKIRYISEFPPMIVVTNEKNQNGAALAFYPGKLEEISKHVGGSYYLIPSSVHDMIAIHSDQRDGAMEESIQGTLRLCNSDRDVVALEDVLSNNFYYYCKNDGSLSTIIDHTVS